MSEHIDEPTELPREADVTQLTTAPVATIGVLTVVIAFIVTVTGLFVLPQNANTFAGPDFGFVEVRSFVALAVSRSGNAFEPFSTLAAFWWRFGALIVMVVLAVLVLVVLTTADRRPFGGVITVIAVIGGLLHGLALAQSTDLRSGAQFIVGYAQTNFYAHAGIGVWVSLAGFGLLAVAGVVLAVLAAPRSGRDDAAVSAEPA